MAPQLGTKNLKKVFLCRDKAHSSVLILVINPVPIVPLALKELVNTKAPERALVLSQRQRSLASVF